MAIQARTSGDASRSGELECLAIRYCLDGIRNVPQHGQLYSRLASFYARLAEYQTTAGRLNEAEQSVVMGVKTLCDGIARCPRDGVLWGFLAATYRRQAEGAEKAGKLELATSLQLEVERVLIEGIQHVPMFGPLHTALASIYKRQFESATEAGHSELATNLAAKVEHVLVEGIKSVPTFGQLYDVLVVWYLGCGNAKAAFDTAEQAVEGNPAEPHCRLARVRVLMANREFEQAVQACRDALNLSSQIPELYSQMTEAFDALGQEERAFGVLDAWIRQFPNDGRGYVECAKRLVVASRPEEAKRVVSEGLKRAATFGPLVTLASELSAIPAV
jgi:tetratricopeptide (TPR) repeat protein